MLSLAGKDVPEDKNLFEKRQLRKRSKTHNPPSNQIASEEMDSSNEATSDIEGSESSFSDEEFEEENDSDNYHQNNLRTKKIKSNFLNDTVEAPNFKLLSFDEYGKLRKKLFIFPTEDKTLCYVYGWDNTEECYKCWRCKKYTKKLKLCLRTAIVCQNEKKENYVKLIQNEHFCGLIKYEPDNYGFDEAKQIVHEPNFKIFNYEEFGVPKSKLVIFSKEDRELCYEYTRLGSSKYYYCGRCNRKRNLFATICKNDSTNETYLKLSRKEHVCKMIKYDPENYKFYEAERIVKAPNFKVDSYQQNDVFKKKLFIFTSLEKKRGYDYFYNITKNKFLCCGCISQNVRATARICQDIDGNDYVKLNKVKHICELRNYGIYDGINYHIFYKPDYQIIEKTIYGKARKKLFIKIKENKDLCYEFTYVQQDKNFRCNRCNNGAEYLNNVRAFICYDDEGNEFIRVYDRPHLCQPLPYPLNNSDAEKIIRPPNYQFLKRKTIQDTIIEKLFIFANEEKSLCYEYFKVTTKENFWECWTCKYRARKSVSARLIKLKNQEEYMELGKNKHECEPIEFVPENAKLNIVKKPNFKVEVGRNKLNRETKRLIIFDPDDSALCYYFACIRAENLFRCPKCAVKKIYVSAKLVRPENDDEYVILNENQHVCEMEKYEPLIQNLKIINHPNFYLEKVKTCKGENERLMIKDWNNENNNLWFNYLWNRAKNVYLCNKCVRKGKTVTAKLYKADNSDDDYIEMGPIEHVCKPEQEKENQ